MQADLSWYPLLSNATQATPASARVGSAQLASPATRRSSSTCDSSLPGTTLTMAAPPGYVRPDYSQSAPGAAPVTAGAGSSKKKDMSKAAMAKAMQIAWSPGRSLFGLVVMMFMIGNRLTIFSIFFLIPVLTGPVNQLMNVNGGAWSCARVSACTPATPTPSPTAAFAALDGMNVNLLQPKLLYTALSVVGLAMGIYKVNSMGLLPVTSADWVTLLEAPQPTEFSVHAVPLT